MAIDLKSPEGLEIARQLAGTTDVLIANFRPGVLDRMGLGYETLADLNPHIIVVEMPGYTSDSPQAKSPAFGAQFDAQSGSATLTGSGEWPLLTGYALGDPAAGLMAGNAVLSALVQRQRTGRGCHVVLAQSEAMMPLLGEYYLAESVGEAVIEGLNQDRRFTPHGMFAAGDGAWVAIAVTDDEQWRALRGLLVEIDPDLTKIDTFAERAAESEHVEAALAVLVGSSTDAGALAHRLQRLGVPAARVQGAAQVCADPQLERSGFFSTLDHPAAGRHRYPALPITINGRRMGSRSAAPTFAQDTASVLKRLTDLNEHDVTALASRDLLALASTKDAP